MKADNRHHCDHCDKMFANPNNDDPDARTMCPECEETGHHGGICLACKGEEADAQASTALVLQPGQSEALEKWDQFRTFSEALVDAGTTFFQPFVEESITALADAECFEVDSQTTSQTADIVQDGLKRANKDWNEERLSVTRSLDKLISQVSAIPKPGLENNQKAITILQQKISAYRAKVREAEQLAQREAERLLREERERLEAEARKREADAAKLRTKAAQQRAADDAARLREEAALVPESVAVATSAPALAVSTTAQLWEGTIPLCSICQAAEKRRPDPKRECPHNKKLALQAILAKWDEWSDVVTLKPAGLNAMARKYSDTLELPGLKFTPRDSYRSKGR